MKFFKDQGGFTQIPLVVFILVGLVASIYLVQKSTNIFPKASEGRGGFSGPPKVSCRARPVCLDETTPCKIETPIEGWCPKDYPSPLPTTNLCSPVKSHTPLMACGKDMYKGLTYVCADGTGGYVGASSNWKSMTASCKSLADLKQEAANKCKQGHDSCPSPSESVVPLPGIYPDER